MQIDSPAFRTPPIFARKILFGKMGQHFGNMVSPWFGVSTSFSFPFFHPANRTSPNSSSYWSLRAYPSPLFLVPGIAMAAAALGIVIFVMIEHGVETHLGEGVTQRSQCPGQGELGNLSQLSRGVEDASYLEHGGFCRQHCSNEAQGSCISFFLNAWEIQYWKAACIIFSISLLFKCWKSSRVPLMGGIALMPAGDGCAASGAAPSSSLVGNLLRAGGKVSPVVWPWLSQCRPLLE